MNDPRARNKVPEANTVSGYLTGYCEMLASALRSVSSDRLEKAFQAIKEASTRGAKIYVAGNGGSSAIASHLCCDWMKGTHIKGKKALKVHSLTENVSLLTALANDFGYEHCLSEQIEILCQPGDLVILISSSGNSTNIVKAAETARGKKATLISLTGFKGGAVSQMADISLHVPVENYGIAEDAHQVLMHVLAQFLYLSSKQKINDSLNALA
ncbi:MAG: SIS domain-containing protein [Deltaproteobacteria bacterium]|nr:SIS domain-containing protein [Deltaproteobacteria bacterium]